MTWLYGAHNPKLKAGVAWYGRIVGDANERTPRHPIDIAPSLTVPVLGLYGAEDSGIPLDTVERMRKALAEGKSGSEIVVYPGAPHGFHADYRPSYRKDAAEGGWKRMLDWMRGHGVA
jgi:carboxymethylenebutenolidase